MTRQKYSKTPPPPRKIPSIPNVQNTNNLPNIPNTQNQSPSFFGTMIQGVALGTGSSIGHKLVDSIFSGKSESKSEPKSENKSNDLDIHIIQFNKCMETNDNNFQECKTILDMYFNCKESKKMNI